MLQYFSKLLAGSGSRLCLLWARRGHPSLAAWQRAAPAEWQLVRRCILLATAHVYRYHAKMFFAEWPWPLVAAADPRTSSAERLSVIRRFLDKNHCCIPFGLARKLRDLDEAELAGSTWQAILLFMAWLVRASVASVETLHARSRRLADPQMNWETFVSNFVSEEARANSDVDGKPRNGAKPAEPDEPWDWVDPSAQPIADAPAAEERALENIRAKGEYARAQSAFTLFHKKQSQLAKAAGVRVNPASRAFWNDVRQKFDQLDNESRAALLAEAQATRGTAAAERKRQRRCMQQDAQQDNRTVLIPPAPAAPAAVAAECISSPFPMPSCVQACTRVEGPPEVFTSAVSVRDVLEHVPPPKAKGVMPFSARLMGDFFDRHPVFGGSSCCFSEAAMKFKETVNEFHGSQPGEFPAEVVYEKHCGMLCASTVPPAVLNFQRAAMSALSSTARLHAPQKKLANVAMLDMLLVAEAFVGGERQRQEFIALINGLGRNGRFPEYTDVALLKIVAGEPLPELVDLRLEHRRDAHVPQVGRQPRYLQHTTFGPLAQMTDEEFTARMISLPNDTFADEIVFRRLSYRLVEGSFDTYVTAGIDPSFDPLTIRMCVASAVESAVAPAPAAAAGALACNQWGGGG